MTTFEKVEGYNQPIVCLHVLDSKYLSQLEQYKTLDMKYHDHRHTNISEFSPTGDWLIQKFDTFIIRTGKHAETRYPAKSDNIVDKPFINDQEDIYDL